MDKIIKLHPNRVWRTYTGGKTLDQLSGEPNPSDSNFPEDWIASLTRAVNAGRENYENEGLSSVSYNGEQMLLQALVKKDPIAILGEKHYLKYGESFGFLLKLLDSSIRLHLQCHPTIPFAKAHLNSNHGKTEGYYILGTRPEVKEPYILMGFQNPPDQAALKLAIESQDIAFLESCFEKIPVKKGDAFYVPGGLPHAIGEGVFMIEIMEPTDLVVRIEFEKAGYILPEKARFMDKGIDFALSMFNMEKITPEEIRENYFAKPKLVFNSNDVTEHVIFDEDITPCFRLNKLIVNGSHILSKEGLFVIIITAGSGSIQSGDNHFEIAYGQKYLIPAATADVLIQAHDLLEMLIALPPL